MSSNTPEGKVKFKVRAVLQNHIDKGEPVSYFHVPASQFSQGSPPDYVVCIGGFHIEVECKTDKGLMTELQKIQRQKCDKSGGHYIVVTESRIDAFKELVWAFISTSNHAWMQAAKAIVPKISEEFKGV